MQTVLPGKPQPRLQAVTTARWGGIRFVAYISGNAVVILSGPHHLVQMIYLDQCEELIAIALDEKTGSIATCSAEEVYIYKPYGGDEGALRWTLSNSLGISEDSLGSASISWGSEDELLVGTSALRLHQVTGAGREIWKQPLSKSVKYALFSPDANMVASCGWYDRNVKIWRRQSFDSDDTRFDFTYLPHPVAVTVIQWRQPPQHEHHHHEQTVDDVLYSVCVDDKIRIWAASDPIAATYLQLWAQIDMQDCLQPRQLGAIQQDSERLVFFIPQDDFARATSDALKREENVTDKQSHALDHLAEIAKIKPDLCVVLDRSGNMSAWGLENVGCKVRKDTDIFNVAHVQDFDLQLALACDWQTHSNVTFLCFLTDNECSSLSLLIHHFDGRISWQEAQVDTIFDPSRRSDRTRLRTQWTGHQSPIQDLTRDRSGHVLISKSDEGNTLVWEHEPYAGTWLLRRKTAMEINDQVIDSCVMDYGKLIVNLHESEIVIWDVQASSSKIVGRGLLDSLQDGSFLVLLPYASEDRSDYKIALVRPDLTISVWSFCLTATRAGGQLNADESQVEQLRHVSSESLNPREDIVCLHGIAYGDSDSIVFEIADAATPKSCMIGHSAAGTIYLWTARQDQHQSEIQFVTYMVVKTGIKNAAFVSGSQNAKVAVVDASKTSLTIWESTCSYLEYEHSFEPVDTIQRLDWTSTANSQSILAVGSTYKITVFAQMRYSPITARASWASVWEVNIKPMTTHPIGDSLWLRHGHIVIGAGNQIFVCRDELTASDDELAHLSLPSDLKASNVLELVTHLNATLPIYHPQSITQFSLAGRIVFAGDVLMRLYETLKYHAPGDELDSHLAIPSQKLYTLTASDSATGQSQEESDDEDDREFSESHALTLNEKLSDIEVPNITRNEQTQLVEGIEGLAATYKLRKALDDNARRYYFSVRGRRIGEMHQPQKPPIPWKEIVLAMHSSSQDILVDHVTRLYQGKMSWKDAADCGMTLWLSDRKALEAQLEIIARNEYTKTDEKNPIDCSLFYLALRKKTVLLGLWRMATWNREQQGTSKLLKNDFGQARWKTAALKNAYALLGKRRFEYAAAWFLLADHLQDAVNVCLNQIGDVQLAVAIARVYEGDESAVLQSLIKRTILPQAANEGNRWQATWAFTMLGQHDVAIRALIEPLHELISLDHPPLLQAHSYLNNEPVLIHLYQDLRTKFLQKPNARFPISQKAEWDFVVRMARTYDRMGCGFLALDLVRNWIFVQPTKEAPSLEADSMRDETKSRRRKSSASALASPKSPVKEKAKPTQFNEPDASSLLDSFGF